MLENRQNILMEFAKGIKEILGKNLTKVILYGSYARGDYNDSSDVDIIRNDRLIC